MKRRGKTGIGGEERERRDEGMHSPLPRILKSVIEQEMYEVAAKNGSSCRSGHTC